MYRFEKPLDACFVALLILGILTIASPTPAQEKKNAPSQNAAPTPAGPTNVRVVNTLAEPVPVTGTVSVSNLPATQTVSGTVSVSNLPAIQNVSIDPAANTVKVDTSAPLSVRGERTALISDQTRTVDIDRPVAIFDPVDVSQYKEIRIWAFVQGYTGYSLIVQILDPGTGNDVTLDQNMNESGAGHVTKVYNPLCERLGFILVGGATAHVRLRIYGRTN